MKYYVLSKNREKPEIFSYQVYDLDRLKKKPEEFEANVKTENEKQEGMFTYEIITNEEVKSVMEYYEKKRPRRDLEGSLCDIERELNSIESDIGNLINDFESIKKDIDDMKANKETL